MTAIWKVPLPLSGAPTYHVEAPGLDRLLTVALQNGVPTLWAEVEPESAIKWCTVTIVGTGHAYRRRAANDMRVYIGTVQDAGFVWHYFATVPQ